MEPLQSPQELSAARSRLAASLEATSAELSALNEAARLAYGAQCETDRGTLEKLAALRLGLDASELDLTAPTVPQDQQRRGAGGVLLKLLGQVAEQAELVRSGLEYRLKNAPPPSPEIEHLIKRAGETQAKIDAIDAMVSEQRALAEQWLRS